LRILCWTSSATLPAHYLKLGWLREAFPDTRVCCFSATCNAFVSARLGELLHLRRT